MVGTELFRADCIQSSIEPHPIRSIDKPISEHTVRFMHQQPCNAGGVSVLAGRNGTYASDDLRHIAQVEYVLAFAGGGKKAIAHALEEPGECETLRVTCDV